jgi:hypothetical protein
MNYEYFFVKRGRKNSKVFRVYNSTPEGAVVILARKLGCKNAKGSLEAESFLGKINIRPTRLETVFGEGQPWTESEHLGVRQLSTQKPSIALPY